MFIMNPYVSLKCGSYKVNILDLIIYVKDREMISIAFTNNYECAVCTRKIYLNNSRPVEVLINHKKSIEKNKGEKEILRILSFQKKKF